MVSQSVSFFPFLIASPSAPCIHKLFLWNWCFCVINVNHLDWEHKSPWKGRVWIWSNPYMQLLCPTLAHRRFLETGLGPSSFPLSLKESYSFYHPMSASALALTNSPQRLLLRKEDCSQWEKTGVLPWGTVSFPQSPPLHPSIAQLSSSLAGCTAPSLSPLSLPINRANWFAY